MQFRRHIARRLGARAPNTNIGSYNDYEKHNSLVPMSIMLPGRRQSSAIKFATSIVWSDVISQFNTLVVMTKLRTMGVEAPFKSSTHHDKAEYKRTL